MILNQVVLVHLFTNVDLNHFYFDSSWFPIIFTQIKLKNCMSKS